MLEGVKTLEQLEKLAFEEGYQIQHKESGEFVCYAQPVANDQIFLYLTDKSSIRMNVSHLHEQFELIMISDAPKAIKLPVI